MWVALLVGCGKGGEATDSPTGGDPIVGQVWFVEGTLDGTTLRTESPSNGAELSVTQLTSAWDGNLVEVQRFEVGLGATLPRFEVGVVAHFDNAPDDTDRWHILDVGTFAYGTLVQNEGDDPEEYPGAFVRVWDAAGSYSDCSRTTGDQAASYFEVTSHEHTTQTIADGTDVEAITGGRFGCTLHDDGGGVVGDFEGSFESLTTTYQNVVEP